MKRILSSFSSLLPLSSLLLPPLLFSSFVSLLLLFFNPSYPFSHLVVHQDLHHSDTLGNGFLIVRKKTTVHISENI